VIGDQNCKNEIGEELEKVRNEIVKEIETVKNKIILR